MSYSNFNTFKLFKNVGINSSSDYMLSMKPNGNNVSFHSSNSIDYNNVDIMSIKNIINKKQNEDLNLSSLNGNTINPVITINNNHSDCRIMTNLNVAGNLNVLNGGINIKKLAINGDYGSNTQYLKSGGPDSDLTWDTIASSPWTTSGNDIYYNSGNVGIGTANPTEKLHIDGEMKFNGVMRIEDKYSHYLGSFGASYPADSYIALRASNNGYIKLNQDHNFAYFDIAFGKVPAQTVAWNFRNRSHGTVGKLEIDNTGHRTHNFDGTNSDDRLKINEELIEDATKTIMKLRPQKYDKYDYLESELNNFIEDEKPVNRTTHEWGFIAQEVYYECPELRKIVNVPLGATLIDNNENMNFEDIRNDPDYSNWGNEKASLRYNSFIALLTKGFQEQQTEINTQQNEINTLKTENAKLKSIIDKLKTANSFEDFKNSL